MKVIKYFNMELVGEELQLTPLEYSCKDSEFEYWLDIIKRSYGQHGEVMWEEVQEPIPQPSNQDLLNAKLLQDNANIQLKLEAQEKLNADLMLKVAQLGGI